MRHPGVASVRMAALWQRSLDGMFGGAEVGDGRRIAAAPAGAMTLGGHTQLLGRDADVRDRACRQARPALRRRRQHRRA